MVSHELQSFDLCFSGSIIYIPSKVRRFLNPSPGLHFVALLCVVFALSEKEYLCYIVFCMTCLKEIRRVAMRHVWHGSLAVDISGLYKSIIISQVSSYSSSFPFW